jgi:hypothetical protein
MYSGPISAQKLSYPFIHLLPSFEENKPNNLAEMPKDESFISIYKVGPFKNQDMCPSQK